MNAAPTTAIRPMVAGDVDRVMEIAASLPSAPQWPCKAYLDALNSDVTPRRIALVAVRLQAKSLPTDSVAPEPKPAAIMGFVVASLLAPQAELEIIAVAAHSQHQGVGMRLLVELEERLRQAGIVEIQLEVRASNQPAIGLYRNAGFSQCGLRVRYYADPIEDAVIMSRRLSAPPGR